MRQSKHHFLPIHFLQVGDVFETRGGGTFIVEQVFDREPIYHRYFYAVRGKGGLRSLWDNAFSHKIKRVYRHGCIIWLTISISEIEPWQKGRLVHSAN